MKILNISPSYFPATQWGGPVFFDYGLNNALSKIPGTDIKVLTTDVARPKASERLNINNIDKEWYPRQEVMFTPRIAGECVSYELLRKLPSLIRWADVVRLSSTYSFPTIPVIFLCRFYKKPLVWTLHGAILDAQVWADAPRKRFKRLWEHVCSSLIGDYDKVVLHVLSELEKKSAEMRIPNVKSVVIPNGVAPLSEFPKKSFHPDGRLRLMYLGRLSQKKGIENLLDAMVILKQTNVELLVYGSGDSSYVNSLREMVSSLGLDGVVKFMGEVVGEDKSAAFLNADVCIVPSHTESFCIVVAEALAHGVPVIASHGTPWSRLEIMQCGLWVNNHPNDLALAIAKIWKMPLEDMGKRGWLWMTSEYSWDSIALSAFDFYRDLASRDG